MMGSLARWIRSRAAWFGWSTVGVAWFVFVYHGCNWLTSCRTDRVRLHIDWELNLPLVPAMVIVYLSQSPFLLLSAVSFEEPRQWRALVEAYIVATAAAGIGFLLLPSEVGYLTTMADVPEAWLTWFQFKRHLVGQHNLCPSLHVAFTWLLAAAVMSQHGLRSQILILTWAGAIIVSTLLVHEHHLVDVIAGAALGHGCFRYVYQPRLNASRPRAQIAEPNL